MGNSSKPSIKMAQNRSVDERLRFVYKNVNIVVVRNDITSEQVDSIVNAANEHLAHGGGVAGAISSRGGPEVQRESSDYVRKHGIVYTGQVAVTGPGRLSCKFIIHAVGPVWSNGRSGEDKDLESAVFNSFKKANELKCRNISIPAISSGIFGYPKPRCAKVMIRTTKKFIDEVCKGEFYLKEIRLTNFDNETTELMQEELGKFSQDPERPIELGEVKKSSGFGGGWGGWGGSGGFKKSSNSDEEKLKEEKLKEEKKKKDEDEEVKYENLKISSQTVNTNVSNVEHNKDLMGLEETKTEEIITDNLESGEGSYSKASELNSDVFHEQHSEKNTDAVYEKSTESNPELFNKNDEGLRKSRPEEVYDQDEKHSDLEKKE